MNNKLYDKFIQKIKNNYKFFLALIILFLVFTVKLPFYIESPGGLLNVKNRVEVDNAYNVSGSFNLAYVSEFKATIPSLLFAILNPSWDVYKKEEVEYINTTQEIEYRNHILLDEANCNAIIVAFNKADEYYLITNRQVNVIYIDKRANTDLQIGDIILEVNDIKINSKNELLNLIANIDGEISFKVENDGNIYNRYAYKTLIDNNNVVGFIISETKDVDTNRDVKFKFKNSESGPSGGFMMSLAIYNYLTKDDLTHNLKIVGTGTIDEDGNVGAIGGIEYKIKGAAKAKADLFFVPNDNYEEALEVVKKNKLKIKLVNVSHIDDAIDYLSNL